MQNIFDSVGVRRYYKRDWHNQAWS